MKDNESLNSIIFDLPAEVPIYIYLFKLSIINSL